MSVSFLEPMTELEAVNEIIGTIGEAPVNTIEDDQVVDSAIAHTLLKNTSRRVQAKGWWFNREYEYRITPDVSGQIVLPRNILQADASGESSDKNLTVRGLKLYDLDNHTFIIESPVYLDLILLLQFEELPAIAREYIAIRAGRLFQQRYDGDDILYQFTREEERDLLFSLEEADIEHVDPNMITDSSSVYRLANRIGPVA